MRAKKLANERENDMDQDLVTVQSASNSRGSRYSSGLFFVSLCSFDGDDDHDDEHDDHDDHDDDYDDHDDHQDHDDDYAGHDDHDDDYDGHEDQHYRRPHITKFPLSPSSPSSSSPSSSSSSST